MPENIRNRGVINYYRVTDDAYLRWAGDTGAIHFGFHNNPDAPMKHDESLDNLTHEIISRAGIKPGDRVLDAGCGFGNVSLKLKQMGAIPYPVSISHDQMVIAKQKFTNEIPFSEQDFSNLAFPDNSFDHVIFCETFVHAENKSKVLSEVARVLKPGGGVFINDYSRYSDKYDQELVEVLEKGWSMSIVSIDDMRKAFQESGLTFEVEEVTQNILPSLSLAAKSASAHTDEISVSSGRRLHREATVAYHKLVLKSDMGYFFFKGVKG